jgi:ABC-type sugar transport system substrate-binding protein
MANYRQKMAGTLATVAQALAGTAMAWAPAAASERSRPVAEVLDVSQTFVPGYPQTFEPTRQIRIVNE